MPLRLNPIEYLLTRLNLLPTPLLDTPLSVGIARMLVLGCELDLFDLLNKRAMTLQELATRVAYPPQSLDLLLQLLVSAGYLRVRHGCYSNTSLSRRWLSSSSSLNIAPYIIHTPDISAIWDHSLEALQHNKPAVRMPYDDEVSTTEQQHLLLRHYAGLASLSMVLGREVVYRTKLPTGAQRLLDVGGSHAGYSALYCRRYPALQATVLDLPYGVVAGKRTAHLMHLNKRIDFIVGDIIKDNFGCQLANTFDAALYFHIAHLLQPEVNQAVLSKVVQTLRPGGMLVFVDQVTDQTHGSRLASLMVQFMNLTMATIGGTCYPFTTVKTWLEDLGLTEVHRHRLLTPGATLITARK